ncbi:LL-diaminopimelate aminotransferase [Candidatus Woesearchaeota archaeon]|nr:LL-diaminopimelate aminotransferase [Candidatus Woesearchaeota archaeon]
MVKRNPNFAKLQDGYLFPEIGRRRTKAQEKNPDKKIISLGVGDTTLPINPYITQGLVDKAKGLGTHPMYSGYGAEQGMIDLREKISNKIYNGKISPDEVFVTDGSKCDIARLQVLFGPNVSIAVQDPSYPVYVDGSVIAGTTGDYDKSKEQFNNLVYMVCTPENNFFPDLENLPKTDLIYICSPNNPTGACATKKQLKEIVNFAKKNKSIIIFDAAYNFFIKDESLPKTIYDIEGAKEAAIEVNSFSKPAGFTGVRLGWTVVPKKLKFDDGFSVNKDWNRVMTTLFNGASNISQFGGLAALDDEGQKEMQDTINYYMENARVIKETLDSMGIKTFGGDNTPYIWAHFPRQKSWDVFEKILNEAFVVTTPGSGFGPAGEGFVRFSGFGKKDETIEAVKRIKKLKF